MNDVAQAEAAARLDDLVAELRRAARALDAEDDAAFTAATAATDVIVERLAPRLAALAEAGAGAQVVARLREAVAEHARLATRARERRDRLAAELARVERPDPIAAAYGGLAARVLNVVR